MNIYMVCSLLFVVVAAIGAFIKPNRICGVRTKWSLYNENTWKKTQRTSAVITAVAGCFIAFVTYKTSEPMSSIVFIAGFLAVAIICTAASYYFYKKELKNEEPSMDGERD